MSLIGKLNEKIEEQEQGIAALGRKVTNMECNGNSSKSTLEYYGLQAVLVPISRSQRLSKEKQHLGCEKEATVNGFFNFCSSLIFSFPFLVLKTKGLEGIAYDLEFFHDFSPTCV